ncbi:MAG: hypothetical protein LBD17_00425, partial [Endomicrobium sp.]|nr:hypothetical protein [Endomicrobium sp.]
MKKKNFVRIIALAILVCVFVTALAGCSFIVKNNERIANQEIYSIIGENGITLSLTRNEIIDYFNNYAYTLINYYSYTAKEALDFVIESKIKNKYLITIAMGVLAKDYEQRKTVLVGNGTVVEPKDCLTWAEFYAAVYSVNESIESSIETSIKEAEE